MEATTGGIVKIEEYRNIEHELVGAAHAAAVEARKMAEVAQDDEALKSLQVASHALAALQQLGQAERA